MYGKHHSEETKNKIRLAKIGTKQSDETIQKKIQKQNKKVCKISLKTGELLKVFDSIKETEKYGFTPSGITECCKGRQSTHKGFKWMYKDDYDKLINN
jgi:hypothetical protein